MKAPFLSSALLAFALLGAGSLFAAPATVVFGPGKYRLCPEGDNAARFREKLVVRQSADHVEIDAREAIKEGMLKLQINTPAFPRAERDRFAGRDVVQKVKMGGGTGGAAIIYFIGHAGKGAKAHHWYVTREIEFRGRVREFAMRAHVPEDIEFLNIRIDLTKVSLKSDTSISLYSSTYGLAEEIPVRLKPLDVEPKLTFYCPFDGTARASVAAGDPEPVKSEGLEFTEGRIGQGVRLTRKAKSLLVYRMAGNIVPERGTAMFWVRGEWDAAHPGWRTILSNPWEQKTRIGSGALWFWVHEGRFRADQSDLDDAYQGYGHVLKPGVWTHYAVRWNEEGVRITENGGKIRHHDGESPMRAALAGERPRDMKEFLRKTFDVFSVGSMPNGGNPLNGVLDELKVYSAPLSDEEIRAEWMRKPTEEAKLPPPPDWSTLFEPRANPYEGGVAAKPGVPENLELVEELKLGAVPSEDRFRAVGATAVKDLGGVPYLEAGRREGSRFALRFHLATNAPLHVFEIDYPDDAKRTCDLILQRSANAGGDYTMQCGYATGDEYPLTGKILTHRVLYWTKDADVTLVAMTARRDAPAAVAAVRIYRVRDGRLPVAAMNEPKPKDGWNRTLALYFEDPAIGYDFSVGPHAGRDADELRRLVERTAALMKFTGENQFAYPGAWYHGLIGDAYNPREHARNFLTAWYGVFDREGLCLTPTLNVNTMPVPKRLVTLETMSNGALQPTVIAIHDTGKPNWGGWHNSPPNFNIYHPDVRAYADGLVDALIAQGADHPSFKGLVLHLTKHCLFWWGSAESGYNDYAIDAFQRQTGVQVRVDRREPLRGAAYAKWLREHAWEKWLQWRCDYLTEFYGRIADRLAAKRSDLKLILNSFSPADHTDPRFLGEDYLGTANREAGLDPKGLCRRAKNLVLMQSMVPADYRWGCFGTNAVGLRQRELDLREDFYSLLDGARFPAVNQHDRYWESAIGKSAQAGTKNSLTCDWLRESPWRVSTINPSGRSALRHFCVALRWHDVLSLSKGGFLIGTYGMEEELVPFAQAFRALPAVVMEERARKGAAVLRSCEYDGKTYFYFVNAGGTPQEVTLAFPEGSEDLVRRRRLGAEHAGTPVKITLRPWELRSFSAPAGSKVTMK